MGCVFFGCRFKDEVFRFCKRKGLLCEKYYLKFIERKFVSVIVLGGLISGMLVKYKNCFVFSNFKDFRIIVKLFLNNYIMNSLCILNYFFIRFINKVIIEVIVWILILMDLYLIFLCWDWLILCLYRFYFVGLN